MENYNHKKIEKKWQKIWEDDSVFQADDKSKKPKYYCLDMFPYTSAEGLHVGHPKSYTATDIVSRYKRACGFEVLHPFGWDAFGLPTENKAIKEKTHPKELTAKYIKKFREQIKSLGFSYDWTRELSTCDSEYYKWTQWLFLQFYKAGLAYKKKAPVNWCDDCKTVLANEQVISGKCERCKNEVEQKELSQWFFKITKYVDPLLADLEKLDWPEGLKALQRNWIGKSEGALIQFKIKNLKFKIDTFTTRPDTLGGATFMVLAPENKIIKNLESRIENIEEVRAYIQKAQKKTELERIAATEKEKEGVELKGIKALNPLTQEELSIWISDYVLASYGTGAIMCVPAHDERDYLFAKKYKLPIKEVIAPYFYTTKGKDAVRKNKPTIKRKTVYAFLKNPKNNKYLCLNWEKFGWHSGIIGGVENNEDYIKTGIREIQEETGYQNIRFVKYIGGEIHNHFFAAHKDVNRYGIGHGMLFELVDEEKKEIDPKHKKNHKPIWINEDKMSGWLNLPNFKYMWQAVENDNFCFTGNGVVINSDKLDGLKWSEDSKKIIEKIPGAKAQIQYKLRDWLISRQRYWGAPIPIIYCRRCWEKFKAQSPKSKIEEVIINGKEYAIIPVPEKDLPVELPDDVDFLPTGESPLAKSKKFHNVKCPKCGKDAHRENDTMDTFVDSSWYFLRYTDPKNQKQPFDKLRARKWLPVDLYIGGAEHAVLHLLYARFVIKALKDLGHIDFDEPFKKLVNQGLILAEDGRKMSKSLGNIINPDDVISEYGADTLRMYEMFMGPLEDAAPWDTKGIEGIKRFLYRVRRVINKYVEDKKNLKDISGKTDLINITVKKVTEDIENLRLNTAISFLMIQFNDIKSKRKWGPKLNSQGKLEGEKEVDFEAIKKFLILLSPFAPHITSELWEKLDFEGQVWKQSWPEVGKIEKEKESLVVIQINGKVRGKITVPTTFTEKEVFELAQQEKNVKRYIEGKKIKNKVYIPFKILNIVI